MHIAADMGPHRQGRANPFHEKFDRPRWPRWPRWPFVEKRQRLQGLIARIAMKPAGLEIGVRPTVLSV